MSFISAAAHQKFIELCRNTLAVNPEGRTPCLVDEKHDRLQNDLMQLEQLMADYQKMLSEFPKLTCMYYNLHRQIRVNLRKLQLKKRRQTRRKHHSR